MALKITDSDLDIEKILSIEDFNTETRDIIKNSEILILPEHLNENRSFDCITKNFIKSARNELTSYQINLCENDGEESFHLYNSVEVWLPHILLNIDVFNDVILPSVINFITAYVFQKLMSEDQIHFKMTLKNNGKNIHISYDGNVSGFKEIEKIKELLKENED